MAKARSSKENRRPSRASSLLGRDAGFWKACVAIRPELALPGYWDTLQQNCKQWADEIGVSPFWKAVRERQHLWSNAFQQKTSGALLASPGIPQFYAKSVERVREKLIHRFKSSDAIPPEESWPSDGPPIPNLNDMVRTRVECQFLDGVEFFASCLEQLASEFGVVGVRERQGKIQGYFAQHFVFEQPVFFRFGGSQEPAVIKCEVQVATALATRIWEESHHTYEEWRTRDDEAEDWQWDPTDPRFIARQLGHMIHLADGLLVQLRNSTK